MYRWFTQTRQVQIAAFVVVLVLGTYLLRSCSRDPKAVEQTQKEEGVAETPAAPETPPAAAPPVPKPKSLETAESKPVAKPATSPATGPAQEVPMAKPACFEKELAGMNETLREILTEVRKDRLAKPGSLDTPKTAPAIKSGLQAYEKALADYKEARGKLWRAKSSLQQAEKVARVSGLERWKGRELELREEVEERERTLAELDQKVKTAKAAIPEPTS